MIFFLHKHTISLPNSYCVSFRIFQASCACHETIVSNLLLKHTVHTPRVGPGPIKRDKIAPGQQMLLLKLHQQQVLLVSEGQQTAQYKKWISEKREELFITEAKVVAEGSFECVARTMRGS